MKVLIYSSKDLYDNSSYEGRAEADLIGYRVDSRTVQITKNRHFSVYLVYTDNVNLLKYGCIAYLTLRLHIKRVEDKEFNASVAQLEEH